MYDIKSYETNYLRGIKQIWSFHEISTPSFDEEINQRASGNNIFQKLRLAYRRSFPKTFLQNRTQTWTQAKEKNFLIYYPNTDIISLECIKGGELYGKRQCCKTL